MRKEIQETVPIVGKFTVSDYVEHQGWGRVETDIIEIDIDRMMAYLPEGTYVIVRYPETIKIPQLED